MSALGKRPLFEQLNYSTTCNETEDLLIVLVEEYIECFHKSNKDSYSG